MHLLFLSMAISCRTREKADLLITNATIYTLDSSFSTGQAMAIKDGKILAVGSNEAMSSAFSPARTMDASGQFIYPGFIDAHAHFVGYATGLQTVDLTGTDSWEACIERIRKFIGHKQPKPGQWIIGRGWDQNDWQKKEFPDRRQLDEIFPANPVFLSRVDGHAAIVNAAALTAAGLKHEKKLIGGEVEVKNGRLTGILIDNAVDLVNAAIPPMSMSDIVNALREAQQNCFAKGLTTLDDCGLDYPTILLLDSLQKAGLLKMKIFAMLSDNPRNYKFIFKRGKIKTGMLTVNAFKVYADGALGSRGACLLQPYSDKAGHYGFLLSDKEHYDSVARLLYQKNFQMCTHAIGDSGNRVILKTYAKYLGGPNDRRWRIEHAQVINPEDFRYFHDYNIIPSVQPTHATSDMYWAGERLGKERIKSAYAFQKLLQQNGWLPLGTDFPVEDIDPLKTFYAAVIRKDAKGWPPEGFQKENALTREQALRGMTIWAAKGNFEEKEKGSLEIGKAADFVILGRDLMKTPEKEILQTRILKTFINGQNVLINK